MSESQLQDRVDEVLNEADASSGSILAGDESADEDESDLLETATEANDILDSADPHELLTAVGLDTLEDGTEPDSIPAAIARGEPANVESLQRLLRLSRLADRADEGCLEGAVDDLRETIGERAESDVEAAEDDAGADERDESNPADSDEGGSDVAESSEDESGTAGDIGDRLRSAMSDSFGEFGDEVSQLKERLESASGGTADDETGDAETAEAAADAEDGDESVESAEDDTGDEGEDEDDGLLGSDIGGDQDRGTSGGPSRHSTMAPPPSQRADMRGTARHSTMPDKHG